MFSPRDIRFGIFVVGIWITIVKGSCKNTLSDCNAPVKLAFTLFNPVSGADDKPPIIYLHGTGASKENWLDIPQATANATKREAYALDARDHGDSEWTDSSKYWTYDCNVIDLFHFMDSMKIPKAIIVGHSMGGITGIKAALMKPERVEKLVVEDIYTKRVPQAIFDAMAFYYSIGQEAVENVPEGADEETAKKFIADYVFEKLPNVKRHEWTDVKLKRTANGRFSFKYNAVALIKALKNGTRVLSDNEGVNEGPALFIYGTLSPFHVGEEKDNIRQYFPNAEFVEIANATHRVHQEHPAEFTEALLKFLLK